MDSVRLSRGDSEAAQKISKNKIGNGKKKDTNKEKRTGQGLLHVVVYS